MGTPLRVSSNQFRGGAPMRLEGWMGLIKPDDLKVRTRAVLMVLTGWIALVLLTAFQDIVYGGIRSECLYRILAPWRDM